MYKNKTFIFFLFLFFLFRLTVGFCLEKETLPIPDGEPFSHSPSMLELPDKTLLVAWYSGSKEKNKDNAIFLSFKKYSGNEWSKPQILVDTVNRANGNPVLFLSGDEIYCFYSSLWGSGWSTSQVFYVKTNFNETNFLWTSPKRIFPFYRTGDLTRGKPIILNDSEFLLPLYKELHGYYSYVCKFSGGKISYNSALVETKPGNLQPSVIALSDGALFMLMRPEDGGHFWQSFSNDRGKTWGKAEKRQDLQNPGSGFDMLKLSSGNIALVFNNSRASRDNLTIALSKDNGKTFPFRKVLEKEEDTDFAYPSAIQDSSGKIHIVYSVDKKGIKHIILGEEEIFQNK